MSHRNFDPKSFLPLNLEGIYATLSGTDRFNAGGNYFFVPETDMRIGIFDTATSRVASRVGRIVRQNNTYQLDFLSQIKVASGELVPNRARVELTFDNDGNLLSRQDSVGKWYGKRRPVDLESLLPSTAIYLRK